MRKNLFPIVIFLLFCSCKTVTTLDSDNYGTIAKRVEVLRKEIKVFSIFKDAEFELFNVNGFSEKKKSLTVPGASSLDYKFAIKVDTQIIAQWTDGMVSKKLSNYDDSWIKQITKERAANWVAVSKPEYFMRETDDVIVIVYRAEGIIFKRVVKL